jgi:hypothetical protein
VAIVPQPDVHRARRIARTGRELEPSFAAGLAGQPEDKLLYDEVPGVDGGVIAGPRQLQAQGPGQRKRDPLSRIERQPAAVAAFQAADRHLANPGSRREGALR